VKPTEEVKERSCETLGGGAGNEMVKPSCRGAGSKT